MPPEQGPPETGEASVPMPAGCHAVVMRRGHAGHEDALRRRVSQKDNFQRVVNLYDLMSFANRLLTASQPG